MTPFHFLFLDKPATGVLGPQPSLFSWADPWHLVKFLGPIREPVVHLPDITLNRVHSATRDLGCQLMDGISASLQLLQQPLLRSTKEPTT